MKSIIQVVQNLLKPYIDSHDNAVAENIAPVETDVTSASQSYAIGKQLILDSTLYDVIAAITAGDALVVNTNISRADDISDTISALGTDVADKADNDVIDPEVEAIGSAALYSHTEGHKFYATNGKMYRASTDIDVGDTLTVGTNCTLDNIIGSFNDVIDDLAEKADSSSLATVATTGSYDDLGDKPTIPSATSIDYTGTASDTGVRYQRVGIGSVYTEIDGTKYMEQTQTLSTSAATTFTFTNAAITADSDIDPRSSIWGIAPSSVTVSAGSCSVVIPAYSSAVSLKVRIYIR
jgi:hypothetical protein